MTNNERIHRFLLCAKSFKMAADTIRPLFEDAEKKLGQTTPPENLLLALPTMTLLALSIELYLKMFIALDNECQPEKTHLLDKLFNYLSKETQARICDLVGATPQQVHEFLEQHQDAFHESRYLEIRDKKDKKDKAELNCNQLTDFCRACSVLAGERWKEHNA